MKNIIFVISIMVLISFFSCENNSNQSSANDTLSVRDSSFVLQNLRDSSNKAWLLMITSDDEKISNIARLLEEISYCKKTNPILLDSLNSVVKTMKAKRYDQETMTSLQIDQYDSFTDSVISRVRFLGRVTKDLNEHPLAETLFQDIATADNDVVRYRNLYDKFAFAYNDYLELNKNNLGNKTANFKKLGVFQLPS